MTWTVPPLWHGQTAFVIAGGPSVARQNLAPLRDRRVIAINSSWQVAPWADFLFFGDARWYRWNADQLGDFSGRLVHCGPNHIAARVLRLRRMSAPPALSADPQAVVMGRTSLRAAMNFAVLLGAARIILLGADMQPAEDGQTHHHKPHPVAQAANCWDIHMASLREIVEPLQRLGVAVYNTSDRSRLPFWERATLEECLSRFPV